MVAYIDKKSCLIDSIMISSYVNPPKKGITPSQNDIISSATICKLDKVAFGVKILIKIYKF